MEELMIGIVLLSGLIYAIVEIKDCGSNPQHESWLTEDKAKHPKLYG